MFNGKAFPQRRVRGTSQSFNLEVVIYYHYLFIYIYADV